MQASIESPLLRQSDVVAASAVRGVARNSKQQPQFASTRQHSPQQRQWHACMRRAGEMQRLCVCVDQTTTSPAHQSTRTACDAQTACGVQLVQACPAHSLLQLRPMLPAVIFGPSMMCHHDVATSPFPPFPAPPLTVGTLGPCQAQAVCSVAHMPSAFETFSSETF